MRESPERTRAAIAMRRRPIAMALITASLCAQAIAKGPVASAQTTSPAAGVITEASEPSSDSDASVKPVPAVDLNRFLGSWYEVARIPAWFQNRCVKDTTARYQLRTDGTITVTNRCITRKGQIDQAVGLARVLDPATKARLQVSFVSLLGWRPFWGDYWVIGLDPEYRWLVVGDPRRQYGWILSRNPVIEPALLEAAFQTLERNGYPRARFVLTPHSDGPASSKGAPDRAP